MPRNISKICWQIRPLPDVVSEIQWPEVSKFSNRKLKLPLLQSLWNSCPEVLFWNSRKMPLVTTKKSPKEVTKSHFLESYVITGSSRTSPLKLNSRFSVTRNPNPKSICRHKIRETCHTLIWTVHFIFVFDHPIFPTLDRPLRTVQRRHIWLFYFWRATLCSKNWYFSSPVQIRLRFNNKESFLRIRWICFYQNWNIFNHLKPEILIFWPHLTKILNHRSPHW